VRSRTRVAILDKAPSEYQGFSVSPDGRRALWPQIDHIGADLMHIEGSR
jgi:hypothetical protein